MAHHPPCLSVLHLPICYFAASLFFSKRQSPRGVAVTRGDAEASGSGRRACREAPWGLLFALAGQKNLTLKDLY